MISFDLTHRGPTASDEFPSVGRKMGLQVTHRLDELIQRLLLVSIPLVSEGDRHTVDPEGQIPRIAQGRGQLRAWREDDWLSHAIGELDMVPLGTSVAQKLLTDGKLDSEPERVLPAG